jgi:hypothetical protein
VFLGLLHPGITGMNHHACLFIILYKLQLTPLGGKSPFISYQLKDSFFNFFSLLYQLFLLITIYTYSGSYSVSFWFNCFFFWQYWGLNSRFTP